MENVTPDKLQTVIGQNVRILRTQAQMSQRVLADLVGVSQAQIARIETGHSLSLELLANLSEALKQPPDLFLRPDLKPESAKNLAATA